MMSRITIDLKKRARKDEDDDLAGHPYCYQMSPLRFRDVVTGRRSMTTNVRPHLPPGIRNPGGVDSAILFAPGVTANSETRADEASEW